ncbi:PP2C family protein-serine/threonine phosphatase [Mesoflavibacter zeaxanthinifaciens]|uniref:PP2C family protein-serine/threonine phosphatase n=1 Tax=Mesoflavibacter zeaxanthinifaciens TaxID=393060 RepID=UPI003A8ECADA
MNWNIISQIGKRKTNQDLTLVKKINSDSYLYLIADGMGGYDNGNIAAEIVIDHLATFLSNTNKIDEATINKAIKGANLALLKYQQQNHSKLGSTLGGIIISGNIAKVFWVGDVKIFHYSQGKLCFESKAHNIINELSSLNSLNKKPDLSKYDHIVTRSVQGDSKKSIPSYHKLLLKEGDQLFICSDGVHNIIDAHTLQYLLNNEDSPNSLIDAIDQRLEKEANDNASLILIKDFDFHE